jgi:hypothetical protein
LRTLLSPKIAVEKINELISFEYQKCDEVKEEAVQKDWLDKNGLDSERMKNFLVLLKVWKVTCVNYWNV